MQPASLCLCLVFCTFLATASAALLNVSQFLKKLKQDNNPILLNILNTHSGNRANAGKLQGTSVARYQELNRSIRVQKQISMKEKIEHNRRILGLSPNRNESIADSDKVSSMLIEASELSGDEFGHLQNELKATICKYKSLLGMPAENPEIITIELQGQNVRLEGLDVHFNGVLSNDLQLNLTLVQYMIATQENENAAKVLGSTNLSARNEDPFAYIPNQPRIHRVPTGPSNGGPGPIWRPNVPASGTPQPSAIGDSGRRVVALRDDEAASTKLLKRLFNLLGVVGVFLLKCLWSIICFIFWQICGLIANTDKRD